MLNQARVLIVEDEAMIALDLAAVVEGAGGCVVGSSETVADALATLNAAPLPHVAILDFRLPDGDVTPLAVWLLDVGVPVVLHTASPIPAALLARTPRLAHCPKPSSDQSVVRTVRALLDLDASAA